MNAKSVIGFMVCVLTIVGTLADGIECYDCQVISDTHEVIGNECYKPDASTKRATGCTLCTITLIEKPKRGLFGVLRTCETDEPLPGVNESCLINAKAKTCACNAGLCNGIPLEKPALDKSCYDCFEEKGGDGQLDKGGPCFEVTDKTATSEPNCQFCMIEVIKNIPQPTIKRSCSDEMKFDNACQDVEDGRTACYCNKASKCNDMKFDGITAAPTTTKITTLNTASTDKTTTLITASTRLTGKTDAPGDYYDENGGHDLRKGLAFYACIVAAWLAHG